MTDPTAAGLAEIAALHKRLADLEALATQQAPSSPPDKPAGFGDAFRVVARDGTASGPAIDALRRQITERPAVPESPSPADLEAAIRVAAGRGSSSIEGAYAAMQANARRRDVIENVSPGGLGRIDPLNQASAETIDKIRRLFEEEH